MKIPNFDFENELYGQGYKLIAGVDEVGRGSFAGPVVAGCVAFRQIPNDKLQIPNNIKINDSKKLTSNQRELADKWIRENCLSFGIGSAGVFEINKHGIKKATEIAFRKAIKNCNVQIDYLLIDAFYIPRVKGLRHKSQKPIIKGDGKSVSIAAASIVAKVYRDSLMTRLAKNARYKKYNWHKNKGYGTLEHREAIQKFGISRHHRKNFRISFSSQAQ